jgi:hypothetical protein
MLMDVGCPELGSHVDERTRVRAGARELAEKN